MLNTQKYYYLLTPVGVMVGFLSEICNDNSIKLLDACLVTQEIETSFVKLDPNDVIIERLTNDQYSAGVLAGKINQSDYELSTDGFVDKLTPINANIDTTKSLINVNTNQIIAFWEPQDKELLTNQLNHVMGRMPVRDVTMWAD